jgi:uncharacterized membrane protein (DUF485 family)
MAGLDFNKEVAREKEDATVVAHNSRMGVILFLVYVSFYAGFMGLSAFWPGFMTRPFLFGMNLAVVYGLALIAVAMLLAMVYMKLCRKPA